MVASAATVLGKADGRDSKKPVGREDTQGSGPEELGQSCAVITWLVSCSQTFLVYEKRKNINWPHYYLQNKLPMLVKNRCSYV